jgi:nicotinate-nucleotide adenylyltransferase
VAAGARDRLALDRVLLIVANDPWQKAPQREITPAADRLAMVEAMVQGADARVSARLEVSDVEIRRGGPSYTVTTLRELAAAEPHAELFLIIGRDLVDGFSSWHESAAIEHLATVVVADRPGHAAPRRAGWQALDIDLVDASSTALRERLQAGLDVASDVPPAVLDTIRKRHLYEVRPPAREVSTSPVASTPDAGRHS